MLETSAVGAIRVSSGEVNLLSVSEAFWAVAGVLPSYEAVAVVLSVG